MLIGHIEGATRKLGRPRGWNEARHGKLATLPIRDEVVNGVNEMVSAWIPTPDEIARIEAGAPIYLRITGRQHPPVLLSVGDPPA
jgi:hypothetical protein